MTSDCIRGCVPLSPSSTMHSLSAAAFVGLRPRHVATLSIHGKLLIVNLHVLVYMLDQIEMD